MLRVLVVDLERAWRGGQSQALLLLKGLRARGHAAELLSVHNAALALRSEAENIPVHTTAETARRWGAARMLRRLLRERQFDIVLVNEAHALTAAWLARVHHQAPLVAARRVAFPISRSHLSLARYRAAACILAVSQAVRTELVAANLDAKRIQIVADGVEIPSAFSPNERSRARERWGLAPDEQVLAFVASFTEEKGHALLLEAFSVLREQAPRCRLLLAGDGPLRAQLEERARSANLTSSVIFAGFVQEIASVYAACDLFVFPSLNEGGGTSLLTAMAYELPVVALARGGVTEIIENGRNGLLIEEAAPQPIAAAAAQLLADVTFARQLAHAAKETVAARFSVDRMVDQTIEVFERLAASTPPRGGRASG